MTKEEILKKNGVYLTDLISSSTMGGIEAAMEDYSNQKVQLTHEWCNELVKEYDAESDGKKGINASYYLGKASGINEVSLFLTGKPIVNDNPPKQWQEETLIKNLQ